MQISGELLSDIPLQLSHLLASGRELREPRAKEHSVREWEETTREENADPAASFLFLHSHRFMYALRGCSGVNKNYVQHGGK